MDVTILRELFQKYFGEPAHSFASLRSHGSNRKIYRLASPTKTAIGISNTEHEENTAFLSFSRHFRQCSLPVPEIYLEHAEQGAYLEEDLGDLTLFQFLSDRRGPEGFAPEVMDIYRQVVETLPRFQILGGKNLNYRVCYPRSSFDRQSMMWDLNYFKYYFLRLSGLEFHEQDLENDFERFARYLLAADRNFFLYRDFQSRNVMIREGKPWFIDYQGGRKGALQYDIASLLFDAKADIPFELRQELLDYFLESASRLIPLDRQEFLKYYPGYVYIRILQALGAYGLRGFYENKTHFLQSIPYAIRNIEFMLRTTELPIELPALMQIFRSMVASSKLRQYGSADLRLTVRIQSFSYKNGVPVDEKGHGGGFVFDCRSLPNPGRFEQFARSTGRDPDVVAFLEKEEEVRQYLDHVYAILDQAVENYRKRNFTDLMVAFGCTGGQHRSVYGASLLARHLREKYPVSVELRHRELEKESS